MDLLTLPEAAQTFVPLLVPILAVLSRQGKILNRMDLIDLKFEHQDEKVEAKADRHEVEHLARRVEALESDE